MENEKEVGTIETPSATTTDDWNDLEKQFDIEKQSSPKKPFSSSTNKVALSDSDLVDWDGPDDPENPMNWPVWKKILSVGIISTLAFLSPLASTISAPVSKDILETFHSAESKILGALMTSIYLLGYVVGPVVLGPLSEMYGRNVVYNVSNLAFIIWNTACAVAPNVRALILFRFLSGVAGSAAMTIGAGTITDMVTSERRGLAMMSWLMGQALGPTVGPLLAGYITQTKGWRWIFWSVSILAGFISAISFLFLRESYAHTILERKIDYLRKRTGSSTLHPAFDIDRNRRLVFKRAILRPVKMLFLCPTVLLLSLYMATTYAFLFILITTLPRVFQEQYEFESRSIGLLYLGTGAGFIAALILSGLISDRLAGYLAKRNNGIAKPEYRLPLSFAGAILAPTGLFLYAWTAQPGIHWIVPTIGSGFVGAATLITLMPCLAYLVDSYPTFAASVSAAAIVSRSLLGAVLPLVGDDMYDALGVRWGTSLLGFIAAAIAPFPVILWKVGESVRHSRYSQVRF